MLYVLGHTNVESIAQSVISISISKGRPLGHGYRKKIAHAPHRFKSEHVAIRRVDVTPVVKLLGI